LHFITLVKLRGKPSKKQIEEMEKALRNTPPGTKIHSVFWTLGRYDLVFYTEGPDERTAMSVVFPFLDFAATETLVAITKEDALKAMGI